MFKKRIKIRGKYRCYDYAINTMLLNHDVPALIEEVERLQKQIQIQKLHAAATRVEDGETDSFDFGQEVLEILGRF